MIGCFDYRDKTAYYVTANSLTDDADVTLNFAGKVNATLIQDAKETKQSGNTLTLSIPKGEGVLIVIE